MKTFSISEAIGYGWRTVKKQPIVIVYLLITTLGAQVGNSLLSGLFGVGDSAQSGIVATLISAITFVATLVLSLGMIRVLFNVYDKKTLKWENLYQDWRLVGWYFIASFLMVLAIVGGIILFIIPGIIISIRLSFLPFVMVDGEHDPIKALKKSWKITKGNGMKLFLFYFVQVFVVLLGVLALVLGVFVAIPVIYLANVFVYKKLIASRK